MLMMTLSQFARHLGCSPASVTRLKKAGRLVLTADGKVDVAAVRAAANEAIDLMRAMVRVFPASISGKIAAASDENQIREILDDGIHDLLQTLADRLAALAEQPGTS